jgi:hypothetical protein
MNSKFYPSINNIYFKNFDIVEDSYGMKHIRGDLFMASSDNSDGVCVGYYNPVYQTENAKHTQCFLRIEEEYSFIHDQENHYESIFNKKAIPLSESECDVGLHELIFDLEIITYLYEFMHNIRPNNDFDAIGLVGIINGSMDRPLMKILQIKDNNLSTDDQIIDFIAKNVSSIVLDSNYPTMIFKHYKDFTIHYVDGKKIDVFGDVV